MEVGAFASGSTQNWLRKILKVFAPSKRRK
jgi:hypothetical protein